MILALAYWYKKGSEKVKKFNKSELIARTAIEKDGILYSRSRIMNGHRFIIAAGLRKNSIGKEVQLDLLTPMLDRHSPISYSVALFIHSELANHAGFETCFRFSLMPEKIKPTKLVKVDGEWVRVAESEVMTGQGSCVCCCPGHCKFNVHNVEGSVMGVNLASKVDTHSEQLEFPNICENYLFDGMDYDEPIKSSLVVEKDELYDVITSLETDFNLD